MLRIILIFSVLSSFFVLSTLESKAGIRIVLPPDTPTACCEDVVTCVDTTWGVGCAGIGFHLGPNTSCVENSCSFVPPSQGDCCEAHSGLGCDVPSCEDTVCNEDSFCCIYRWDYACQVRAEELCGTLCEDSSGPIVIIPTMTQWGIIFASIILGAIGIVAIIKEKNISRYFDE